jgi:hypothetical protein
MTEHELTETSLGPPFRTEGKAGLVRELDIDLLLTPDRVIELLDWLTDRLEELERLKGGGK